MYTSLELAEVYLQTGELNYALEALNAHIAESPQDDYARRLRIEVLIDMPNGINLALADLDDISALTARDYGLRGRIMSKLGDLSAAAAAFEQAWKLRPMSYAEPYLMLLKKLGNTDRALEVLSSIPKAWHWFSWGGEIHMLRGDHEAALQHFSEAVEQLDTVIESMKDPRFFRAVKANLLIKRGKVYHQLKRILEADADYREAGSLLTHDATIPFNRGLLHAEQGDLANAISLCREGWDRANADLREEMREELITDPRYQPILEAISG